MPLRELTIRYTVKTDDQGQPVRIGPAFRSPATGARLLATLLADEAVEVFAILCLTAKHHIIAYHEVSRGTLDTTFVHPRDIFKAALLVNAAAVVLTHYVARYIMRVMWRDSLCGGSRFEPANRAGQSAIEVT